MIQTRLAEAQQRLNAGQTALAEQTCLAILEMQPGQADALHLLGVAAFQQGKHEAALARLREATQARPGEASFHYNLGTVYQTMSKHAQAVPCFEEAIRLKNDYADAHCNLGYALTCCGQAERAVASLQQALRLRPGYAEAHNNLGLAQAVQGRWSEAVESYRQAIGLRPGMAEAHYNLGLALVNLKEADQAMDAFREALRWAPAHAAARSELAKALHHRGQQLKEQTGKLEEAVTAYQEAVSLVPHSPGYQCDLGNALMRVPRVEDAATCYRTALALLPTDPMLHSNLGYALTLLGRPDEGVASCEEALKIDPKFAGALHNRGIALLALGRPVESLASTEQALAVQPNFPEARLGRAFTLLSLAKFEEGWPEYEARWHKPGVSRRTFAEPQWDGTSLAGKTVLLYAEQGLGDTIQFIRYAPLVKELGGRVIVECPPALVTLLSSCAGIDQLVAKGTALPSFDVQAPIMSLPWIMGTTEQSIPVQTPYLSADPQLIERWSHEFHGVGGLKVGLCWQGSITFAGDRLRSFALANFAPLARLDGVRLYSLQKGAGSAQLAEFASRFPIVDLARRLDESSGAFTDTAAVMKHLDLVVTSDTSVAHLAGALGVPVWIVLNLGPDWRWLVGREDCPWYPTARLVRQRRLGDWNEVIERLAAEIQNKSPASGSQDSPLIEVSPGELLDKICILQIKSERITDKAKLRNVRVELDTLLAARDRAIRPSPELDQLARELKTVNEELWEIEDAIRDCEREQKFGRPFVKLARSVYHKNDHRAALKRQVNDLLGSKLIEEKAYAKYTP